MQGVLNNPYRHVGLLVGASVRELNRQITKVKAYLQAEQEPQEDYSFPALGKFTRSLKTVEQAASRLNLNHDKLNAAILWFWNGRPVTDEAAFDALKEGDIANAYDIWDKLTTETNGNGQKSWKPISEKNASAFQNIATLIFAIDKSDIFKAVVAKFIFIESSFFEKLASESTDANYKAAKNEIELKIIKEVLKIIDSNKIVDLHKHLSEISFSAKPEFLKLIIQTPLDNIEQNIEASKNVRKSNKTKAAEAGLALFNKTSSDLELIKRIVGSNDLRYSSVTDKVANELLQCSIDYYNDCHEKKSNTDYTAIAMQLAKKANSLAAGHLTKDRVKESIATLEEMQDREISTAIQVLKTIKKAYEQNKNDITEKVRLQEKTDIEILMGRSTINWEKVKKIIDDSINWNKAVELVLETIPFENIEKIKNTKSAAKINEYKQLVIFFLGKLTTTQYNNVSYLHYWEPPMEKIPPKDKKPAPPTSTPKSNERLAWIVAIIVSIICLNYELGWVTLIIFFITYVVTAASLDSLNK
jgi:hypothetical protein